MEDDKKPEFTETGRIRESDDEFWKRGLDNIQHSMNELRVATKVAQMDLDETVVVAGASERLIIAGRRMGHAMHRSTLQAAAMAALLMSVGDVVEAEPPFSGVMELNNYYDRPVPYVGYAGGKPNPYRVRDTKKYDNNARLKKKLAKKSKQRNRKK